MFADHQRNKVCTNPTIICSQALYIPYGLRVRLCMYVHVQQFQIKHIMNGIETAFGMHLNDNLNYILYTTHSWWRFGHREGLNTRQSESVCHGSFRFLAVFTQLSTYLLNKYLQHYTAGSSHANACEQLKLHAFIVNLPQRWVIYGSYMMTTTHGLEHCID